MIFRIFASKINPLFIRNLITIFFLLPIVAFCQRTVTGRVLDANTRKPIADIRVSVQGTDQQTTTNVLGFFQLQISEPGATMIISNELYGFHESIVPESESFIIMIEPKQTPGKASDVQQKDAVPVPVVKSPNWQVEYDDWLVESDTLRVDFHQIQKEEITFDILHISKDFCDLKVRYERILNLFLQSDDVKDYIFRIDFNHKIEDVEKLTASVTDSESSVKTLDTKTIKAEKLSKTLATKSIYFTDLGKGSKIRISYEIVGDINEMRSVRLNDTIPKLKSYFNFHIPDYLKVNSNYDSISPPVRIQFPAARLTRYNPKAYYGGKPYYKSWETFTSRLLIWDYDNLPGAKKDKLVELHFKVAEIALLPSNDYGLKPSKVLKSKK